MNLAVFNIGNLAVGYVDIVIVVLFIIAIIVGLCTGFLKKFLGFIKLILSGAAAYFGGGYLATWLNGRVVRQLFQEKCIDVISNLGGYFVQNISEIPEAVREDTINELVNSCTQIPGPFKEKVAELLKEPGVTTPANAIGKYLGELGIKIISFVVVFLVAFLVLSLIFLAFRKAVKKHKVINAADRLIGMLFGIVRYAILIFVLLFLVEQVININLIPSVSEFLSNDIGLGSEGFGITKWLIEHNPLMKLITLFK